MITVADHVAPGAGPKAPTRKRRQAHVPDLIRVFLVVTDNDRHLHGPGPDNHGGRDAIVWSKQRSVSSLRIRPCSDWSIDRPQRRAVVRP